MIDSRKIVDIPHPPILTKNTEKTATYLIGIYIYFKLSALNVTNISSTCISPNLTCQ